MNTLIEIGIAAYNEEANIKPLLQSIFDQKQDIYKISKVTLISDGSTDRTVEIASNYKTYNKVKLDVIDSPDRKGKATRDNELFHNAKSDILVIFDADVVMGSDKTISFLITPILSGKATLTSGRPVKVSSHTFTDHVMDVSLYLQDQVKIRFRNGQSVYACHGRIVALHRKLYETMELPGSSVGDDAYLYFYNREHGSGFAFTKKATVKFKMPQSLHDFVAQQRRFSTTPEELATLFDEEILSEYKIPASLAIYVTVMALFKYHIYCIGYIFYRVIAKFSRFRTSSRWTISETTKRL